MIAAGLDSLFLLADGKTRAITAENPRGEKGRGGMAVPDAANAARDLGQGWKVAPCVQVAAGSTFTFADIEGPGAIQHLWLSGNVANKGPGAGTTSFAFTGTTRPSPRWSAPRPTSSPAAGDSTRR